MKSDHILRMKKRKIFWSIASWILHRYQLNMLSEIYESSGFSTIFSGAILAVPFFACLFCFVFKSCSVKGNAMYIFLLLRFPNTNFPKTKNKQKKSQTKKQQNNNKKERKNNKEWLTNTNNYALKYRKILKIYKRNIYGSSMGHRNLQKWKAHS